VTELNKQAVDKRKGSYYIKNPIPDTEYIFEVQGCEVNRVNNQARCTQWKKTFHKTSPQVASNNLPYGKKTCKQGFVWRETIPSDHVCVTPEERTAAAEDNSRARDRRVQP
jgi:hypothetical protein